MYQLSLDDLYQQEMLRTLPGRTAYIDECGNFGFDFSLDGTSKYYILCAIVVDNTKIADLHAKISEVKQDNGFANTEMKSSTIGNQYKRRNKIISELLSIDFRTVLFVADKKAFADESPLHEYKEPFIKYLHQRLYNILYHAYPKLKIIEDEQGYPEFQDSFKRYISNHRPKPSFFDDYDFDYCDSKDELLVQLADIVGGTIYKFYTDQRSPNYLEMLKGKILSFEVFPNKQEPYWGSVKPSECIYSKEIFTLALKCADDFISYNESADSHEKRMQVAFLRYLKFHVLNINPTQYISSGQLISSLSEYTSTKVTRDFLFRHVIAPLRDQGIILASCSHGYKIPISVVDIITYLNQTHTVVAPMLHRMEICRNLVKQATGGILDILDDDAFLRYKHYFC